MRKTVIILIDALLLIGCTAIYEKPVVRSEIPGPSYFSGRVSASEIYAGAINVLVGGTKEGRSQSIIYLKNTPTDQSNPLSPYVERLVRKPLRPIIFRYQNESPEVRWPVLKPIKRVSDGRQIWPKGAHGPINNGTYVELGPIISRGQTVEIEAVNSYGEVGAELMTLKVSLANGRLEFSTDEIIMASGIKGRQFSGEIALTAEVP